MTINRYKLGAAMIALAAACGQAQAAQTTSASAVSTELMQDADRPALLDTDPPKCKAESGEVVVCGERSDRYRIDPVLMEVSRKQAARNDRKAGQRSVAAERCSPVGANGCPGKDVIPVTAVALVALKAGVAAAKGEEWTEVFRTQPDEYLEHQKASERAKRRNRVSVSIGSPR
jgi:hypothetical protein